MGFFCGIKGSTVGGSYCYELTQTQTKYQVNDINL